MENRDEFDDLLDEAEKNFFPPTKETFAFGDENIKKSSSRIDELMDELLDDDDDDRDEEETKRNDCRGLNEPARGTQEDGSINKCFPVLLGGSDVAMGMTSRTAQRSCDKMRCMSCDFHVIWFNDFHWSDSCDYYFLRNNVPNDKKLKEKLIAKKGFRSYACQCSWTSVKDVTRIPKNLKWICTKHKQQ